MATYLGNQAESIAARYIEKQGLIVLSRNWRNRWCEIDIVAKAKDDTIHIIEVKYRRSTLHGAGVDYVTPQKAERLRRAATVWMQEYKKDVPFQIDVISITGNLTLPTIDYLANAIID